MPIDISDTLYSRTDIRLSARIAAEELAKNASPDGTVTMAYEYLAMLMNVCKRTAIRAVNKLIEEAGILTKQVKHRVGSHLNEINVYTFIVKFRKVTAHLFKGDRNTKLSSIPEIPRSKEELKKEALHDVREELRRQERLLRLLDLTPGSPPYEAAHGEIARLKALLTDSEPANVQEGG